MADGVGERLLGDPVEAEGDLGREGAFGAAQAEPHRQPVPPLDLRAVIAQRLGQPEPLEDRGVEVVAQAVQIFAQPNQTAAESIQRAPPGITVPVLPADRLELQGEGGEPLAIVVVELAGDPAPGVLVHITAPPVRAASRASSTRLSVPSLP